jgi:DNA modification methylase
LADVQTTLDVDGGNLAAGGIKDVFKNAFSVYGFIPLSIWRFSAAKVKEIKEAIGDVGSSRVLAKGGQKYRGIGLSKTARGKSGGGQSAWQMKQTRAGSFSKPDPDGASVYGGKVTASIFNPALTVSILKSYAKPGQVCFDPFAGGGTRALGAAYYGMRYCGVEIRQDEVDAILEKCRLKGVLDSVEIVCGDARECPGIEDASADFLLTCPPYWDLEQYDGGAADLSMIADYPSFVSEMKKVVAQTARILRPGSESLWVVGDYDKGGEEVGLHYDVRNIHKDLGFKVRKTDIYERTQTGAEQRIGNFSKRSHLTIRVHEYIQRFISP